MEETQRWNGEAIKGMRVLPHKPQPQYGIDEAQTEIEVHVGEEEENEKEARGDKKDPEVIVGGRRKLVLVTKDREIVPHEEAQIAEEATGKEAGIEAEDKAREEEDREKKRRIEREVERG